MVCEAKFSNNVIITNDVKIEKKIVRKLHSSSVMEINFRMKLKTTGPGIGVCEK